MSSKGQITIFMIIGFLVLGTAGFFFFADSSTKEIPAQDSVLNIDDPNQFENYIESCIREEAKPLLKKIASNAGTLVEVPGREYDSIRYNYLCMQDLQYGCINMLRTRESMERELRQAILDRLPLCIDIEQFEKQGYDVKDNDMDLDVTIGSEDVDLTLNYPIEVSKSGLDFKKTRFAVNIRSKLGKLYDLATRILNSEIIGNSFDKDRWMKKHGAEIEIEKHKPYPDTVYSLKKYSPQTGERIVFNFAVQGEDTVTKIGTDNQKHTLGFCYTQRDNNCYANARESGCKGTYSEQKPQNCQGLSDYGEGCIGECDDCGDRKHGETWCEYDGITGQGLDYVGSRHFLRSCFDGKIYYEECRDYRQEICVSDGDKAVCRDNRWEDCALQTNQASCEDQNKRDCVWDYGLKKSYTENQDQRCYPEVPSGFKHWQANGLSVCQLANEQNDCDGAVCPQDWVDSAARYCYYMGDCGNARNIADQRSTMGYFNSMGEEGEYVYTSPGLTEEDYELNLASDIEKRDVDVIYANPMKSIQHLLKRIAEYTEVTTSWDKDDFIWQYIWEGEVTYWTRHTAVCSTWQTPLESRCHLCDSDPNKPCSEYRCKSLGSQCIYEENQGLGNCTYAAVGDNKAPELKFNSVKSDFSAEETFFAGFEGWKSEETVSPNNMIRIVVDTDEDAQCKISMLPMLNFDAIFGTPGEFSKSHEFVYRIPDSMQIINYMKQTLEIISLVELSGIDKMNNLIDEIKRDAKETASEFDADASQFIHKIDSAQERFNNDIMPQVRDALDSMRDTVKTMMLELESNRHIVFIKCRDRAGNENTEKFVKFELKEDTQAPTINNPRVTDGKLIFTIDEDAECRYSLNNDKDFESMEKKIFCEISYNQNSNLALTAFNYDYRCEKELNHAQGSLYIRCKDNPPKFTEYRIDFEKGNMTRVKTGLKNFIDINQSFINLTNDFALQKRNTTILTSFDSINLSIQFDENNVCRYSDEKRESYDSYPPQNLDCKGKVCSQILDTRNNVSIYMGCINQIGLNRNTHETGTRVRIS